MFKGRGAFVLHHREPVLECNLDRSVSSLGKGGLPDERVDTDFMLLIHIKRKVVATRVNG